MPFANMYSGDCYDIVLVYMVVILETVVVVIEVAESCWRT